MTQPIQKTGILGEALACKYLQRKGYQIIERNFQNNKGYKYGEIDIIATIHNKIVFVEVKTRRVKGNAIVIPEENISVKKLQNIEKTASTYLHMKKLWNVEHRFDALSVFLDLSSKKAQIKHMENIFL